MFLRATTGLVGLVVLTAGATAAEVTLNPIQDTFVQSTVPDQNFGKETYMTLGKGTYWNKGYGRGLVEFDLTGLPSNPDFINSAVLSLYQYETEPAAGGLPVDVKRVTETWGQASTTWNKHPTYDDNTVWADADVGDSFHKDWIDWDVTGLVKAQVVGDLPNHGWLLKSHWEQPAGASRMGYVYSMDYAGNPALRPKLVVDYVPEPTGLLLVGLAGLALRRR